MNGHVQQGSGNSTNVGLMIKCNWQIVEEIIQNYSMDLLQTTLFSHCVIVFAIGIRWDNLQAIN